MGQKVEFLTSNGQKRARHFRVAEVTKRLGSVSRTCLHGNRVIFDDEGSYSEHKASGRRTRLEQRNGVYVLEATVDDNGGGDESSADITPFGGRGM